MLLRAVLDACVLVPAALRDTLLTAAEHALYRPVWSPRILEELRKSLRDDLGKPRAQVERLVDRIEKAFPEASVEVVEGVAHAGLADPGDFHVVEAAMRAEAAANVTFNVKHFDAQSLEVLGIELQHPDEFLTRLFRVAPDRMTGVLQQQAARLRNPPMTLWDVLARLRCHVPEFASAVERHLGSLGRGLI